MFSQLMMNTFPYMFGYGAPGLGMGSGGTFGVPPAQSQAVMEAIQRRRAAPPPGMPAAPDLFASPAQARPADIGFNADPKVQKGLQRLQDFFQRKPDLSTAGVGEMGPSLGKFVTGDAPPANQNAHLPVPNLGDSGYPPPQVFGNPPVPSLDPSMANPALPQFPGGQAPVPRPAPFPQVGGPQMAQPGYSPYPDERYAWNGPGQNPNLASGFLSKLFGG